MKLLIAYDGSASAKAAIEDLHCAGLPDTGIDARIITVGESRAPNDIALNLEPNVPIATYVLEHAQEYVNYAREAAENDAEEARNMLAAMFPHWKIETSARVGSPASCILEMAEAWKPELIVMGSHGRSAIGRLFLGSVSMRVATEAPCSVRIVKHKGKTGEPVILVAFDGSETSRKVIHHIMQRTWPMETMLHIVTVIDVSILGSLDYVWLVGGELQMYQHQKESRLEHAMHALEGEMNKHFRTVTTAVPIGSPASEILAEAKRVGAATIFVGSRGLSGLTRALLGSTGHGIAARAEMTVEIVR